MAPTIGITAWPRAVDLLGMPQPNQTVPTAYVSSVTRSGGVPVLLPTVDEDRIDDLLATVDAVILTGGGDVAPDRYGSAPEPETDRVDPRRDRFDIAVARRVLDRRTPTLAVCRGLQIVNVARGGSLHQHVPSHRCLDRPKDTAHQITVTPTSRLARITGTERLAVNSLHHQSVEVVGSGLEVTGRGDDGIVEAVECTDDDHLVAVQWHPELLRHRPDHLALFEDLVDRAAHR
jgi:putative glutamine amidotransferase